MNEKKASRWAIAGVVVCLLVMLLSMGVRAEGIQCASKRYPDNKPEYVFRIIAEKAGIPRVWFAFDPAKLSTSSPSTVLYHSYTGMRGGNGPNGLGVSTIFVKLRSEDGKLLDPQVVIVDWVKGRLAYAYASPLDMSPLLIVRDDFSCDRLD